MGKLLASVVTASVLGIGSACADQLPMRRPRTFELDVTYTHGQGGTWTAHLSADGGRVGTGAPRGTRGEFPVSSSDLDRLYDLYRGATLDGHFAADGFDCPTLELVGRVGRGSHEFRAERCAPEHEVNWGIERAVEALIERAPTVPIRVTFDASSTDVRISDQIFHVWSGAVIAGVPVWLDVLPGQPLLWFNFDDLGPRPTAGGTALDTSKATTLRVHRGPTGLSFD